MKKILFNNIGNRHLFHKIKDKKEEKENFLYNAKRNFRLHTKEILENWDQHKDYVELYILGHYLNKLDKEKWPEKIILFVTDQENEMYNAQDTIYAGEIIKKILQEEYKYEENDIQIIKIKENPANENFTLPEYKNHFISLNYKYPEDIWYFLDAGGTPQQKLACKLLMKEIHGVDKTLYEYISNVEGVSSIPKKDTESREPIELEKFFSARTIKGLVQKGYYSSALALMSTANLQNRILYQLLKLASNRMNHLYKREGSLRKSIKNIPFVKAYITKKPTINSEVFSNYPISQENIFFFEEYLHRADFLLQTGRINDFILKFQQAFEFLLSALIKEKINENCGNTNFDKEICAYEEWAEELNLPREHFSGIPARLNLLLHGLDSYSKLKDLIQIYSNINSGYINNYTAETLPLGIDSLRNRLAHEGIGIREEDNIEHITSAFEGIKNLLNIENSEVNYINMNSKILDEIYRYT